MSRMLKVVLWAAVLEMVLVALAAPVWRWGAIAGATDPRIRTQMLVVGGALLFFPICIAAVAWLATRRMARSALSPAPDARRYNEITFMATIALAVGVQAWCVGVLLQVVEPNSVRLVEALSGVFLMVAGNFLAKISPPTGEHAPDPAAWSRGMLRIGWVGVGAGLTIVVASIAVPTDQMIWVILAASGTYALAALLQRRTLQRRPA